MITTDQTTGHYATVNGLALYYEVPGDEVPGDEVRGDEVPGDEVPGDEVPGTRPPLVLLHGGLLTADSTFRALLPALAECHRVIAVEMQGHGHTADIEREPTLAAMSGDVVAVLDHLGVERADLFGFSLGGLVALQTALTQPSRVARLVLAGVQMRPDGYHHDVLDPASHPDSTRMPSSADSLRMVEDYRAVAPDPGHFEAFAERLQLAVGGFPGWPAAAMQALVAPTLLMIGDNDFVRIEHAAEMLELIPDAQLAVVPGATHVSLTSRAEIVLPIVEGFLRSTAIR